MKKLLLLTFFCLPVFIWAQSPKAKKATIVAGVTAHRGYSTAFPENTLSSFKAAIEVGADWIELDIHKTKDGKIVVSHDATTKRNGNIDVVIANATYDELMKVDIATGFRERNHLTLSECPVQRIPLLSEALEMIMKYKRTKLSIHPKVNCVKDAMVIIRAAKADKMVGFNSSSLPFMTDVKEIAPQIPVFWDRPATLNVDEDIRIAKEKGFETLIIHYDGITAEKINKIHAANLKVGAWNVIDAQQMQSLLKLGIDHIYADDPKLLIEIKKGM